MQCPSCQEAIPEWGAFCPNCGSPLPAQPARPGASLTQEIFGSSTEPYAAAPPSSHPTPQWAPAPEPYVEQAGYHHEQFDDQRTRRGLAMILGAAAVLVAVALGFVIFSVLGVSGSDPAAQPDTSTSPVATPSSPAATPEASPTQPVTPTPSSSASASPTVEARRLPAGAVACGVSGEGDTAAVFSGNRNTSCPFALAVAAAYRQVVEPTDPVEITAYSPVTGKDYSLSCTGVAPTTCVTTTGAMVHLTRAD